MKTLISALIVAAGTVGLQHRGHDPAGAHGASIMGFSQTETSHHFRLSPKGGAIEVHVHDAKKNELRQTIVTHLRMIADSFSKGDFSTPQAVHSGMPDGAGAMAAHRGKISYTFEEGSLGGRIIINTDDPAARDAVHAFLRYQIREHRTGDSEKILN